MKNKLIYLFLVISFFFVIPSIKAETAIVNDKNGVNIRQTPDASSNTNIIFSIKYNTKVTIVDNKLVSGSNCNKGWYKITYNETTGYICSDYLTVTNDLETFYAKVNTSSYISVRSLPTSNSTRLDKIITGTTVTIISKHNSGSGCNSNWLYVSYNGGKKGYVCGSYINTNEDLRLNSSDYTEEERNYANALLKAGFKESYLPYLMKMHRNHPTWNFVPLNLGIKWSDLISGEEWKNKIEGTTTTTLDYFIIPGTSGTEGGDWYYTNNGVNAYFLDPRNFLSDVFIFMFEDLSYNREFHTSEVVKKFFGSSYLSSDEYVGYYMEAAEKYKVSPLHLAARTRKEGAANEDYGAITGTYTGSYNSCKLTGYYNFYNIGSSNSWMQGLYYAAGKECDRESTNSFGRPWKTRKDAILGGAQFIANNYVGDNQNTLYFQKFNTSSAPFFTNQYMTNIMAPSQEGESVYDTIEELGLLDENFTFIIPVYEEMPEIVNLPSIQDSDASLSSIKIDNKVIDNFDRDVVEYIYYVDKSKTSINISATPTKVTSKVNYNQNIELVNDETIITITSVAENGNVKTYIITVKKVNSVTTVSDIISKLSVKITDNYMRNISVNTSANTIVSNIKQADPYANVIIKDRSGKTVSSSSLLSTNNTITLTSACGETKSYTIVVRGDSNGDGGITILDLLKVQKHLLNSSKLSGAYEKAADTNDDGKVTILDLLRVQKYLLKEIEL